MLCHPVGHYQGDTLVERLHYYFGDEARLVHRLDQNTSGLMVIARSLKVARIFYKQFSHYKVHKEYCALVHEIPQIKTGFIDFSLQASEKPENIIKIKMETHPKGMSSHTFYEVLQEYKNYSLLRVVPTTGRKHQIRKHLAFIGHPIVGESLYFKGGLPFLWDYYMSRPSPWHIPVIGHCLSAYKIEFIHPMTEEVMNFSIPIPSNWKILCNEL